MELNIKDKIALVCGASTGLGRAIAHVLAEEGATVIVNARSEGVLSATAQELSAATGSSVVAIAGDVGDSEVPAALVREIKNRFGQLDILVTNAGGPPSKPSLETSDDEWEQAIATHLMATQRFVRAAAPGMKARSWGRILMVTSVSVRQPIAGLVISNAVRAAVTGYAKTVAAELAPHGITVNTIMPGFTLTKRLEDLATTVAQQKNCSQEEVYSGWVSQIPANRLGDPRELASLAAFLASERAGYITGCSIPVDGGFIKGL